MGKNSTASGYVVVVTLYWEPGQFNLVIDRLVGDVSGENGGGDTPLPSPTPNPTPAPEDDLWAPAYFETFNSRHYGMGMSIKSSGGSSEMSVSVDMDVEVYIDGDRSAMVMELMGMPLRYVVDGGKQYLIDDTSKTVTITTADTDTFLPDTSSMTFVGVSEDTFQGQTMYCEIWNTASGRPIKWFFDTKNEWIEGFSTVTDDGTLNETYIAWLHVDYDEAVFDIPADYTVVQG
jgi:hypothetical protein